MSYEVDSSTGCWLWQGAKTRGYGVVRFGGVLHYAHRLMYLLVKGKVPKGKVLDHLCRTRHCINPDHLEPVKQQVNAQRGDRAKLTTELVRAAREASESGESFGSIGRRLGIDRSNISRAVRREQWCNV